MAAIDEQPTQGCGKNGLIYSTAMVMRSETSGFFGTQPRMTQVPWDVGQAGEPSWHCKGDSLTAMKVYGGFRQPLPPSLQFYIHIVISPWHPPNHFLHPKGSSWHPPNHHFLHKGPPRPPAVSLVLTMAKGNSATATCDNMPTQNWVCARQLEFAWGDNWQYNYCRWSKGTRYWEIPSAAFTADQKCVAHADDGCTWNIMIVLHDASWCLVVKPKTCTCAILANCTSIWHYYTISTIMLLLTGVCTSFTVSGISICTYFTYQLAWHVL